MTHRIIFRLFRALLTPLPSFLHVAEKETANNVHVVETILEICYSFAKFDVYVAPGGPPVGSPVGSNWISKLAAPHEGPKHSKDVVDKGT